MSRPVSWNACSNCAYTIPRGIIVDTHVQRVCQRLGLTAEEKPEKIEQQLMAPVPQDSGPG
jgi:endonuclease-3